MKRFALIESVFLVGYVAIFDAVGLIIVFFGLDDLGLLDLTSVLPMGYFLFLKGMGFGEAKSFLTASGLELIPYAGALPINTLGMILNIYRANHPESAVAKVASRITAGPTIKNPKGALALKARAQQ